MVSRPNQPIIGAVARRPSSAGILTSVLLVLLPPTLLAFMVLPFAAWGFTDDDIFLLQYLQGTPVPPPIWPHEGRFWPLGHQEWRLLAPLQDVRLYHGFAILQYSVFCAAILTSLRLLNIRSFWAYIFIVSLPPLVISFANLVFPERSQMMFFSLWLVAYLIWNRNNTIAAGIVALLFCNITLYYKEPTFLFFLAFGSVMVHAYYLRHGGSNILRIRWCDVTIIFSTVLFLMLYFSTGPINVLYDPNTYNEHSLGLTSILPTAMDWVRIEPLIYVLGVFGLILNVRCWIAKGFQISVTDALFAGALSYCLALLLGGLTSKYYLAIPLTCISFYFLAGMQCDIGVLAYRIIIGVLVFINACFFLPSFLYRYDWITRNTQIVGVIENLRLDQGSPKVLVSGDPWDIVMFALFADEVRRSDLEILSDGSVTRCWWKPMLCRPQLPGEQIRIRVDLGETTRAERYGAVEVDGKKIWEYRSWWKQRLLPMIPAPISRIVEPHYSVW